MGNNCQHDRKNEKFDQRIEDLERHIFYIEAENRHLKTQLRQNHDLIVMAKRGKAIEKILEGCFPAESKELSKHEVSSNHDFQKNTRKLSEQLYSRIALIIHFRNRLVYEHDFRHLTAQEKISADDAWHYIKNKIPEYSSVGYNYQHELKVTD